MGGIKISPADSPVTESLIMICEKCGKKLSSSDENPARLLQLKLKERIKADGYKGEIRAVITSCMDVCPDGEITVAIASAQGKTRFLTLKGDWENAVDPLIETARSRS